MSQPQIQTFDPSKQRQHVPSNLTLVVNAIDIRVSFDIGGVPGSKEAHFVLEPGEQAMLPTSYTKPIVGAGRDQRDSVLMMLTGVEAYSGGPRIQSVVPLEEAEATAKAWAAAKANRPTVATVMLRDDAGNAVPVGVPIAQPQNTPPAKAPAQTKVKEGA